MKRILLFLGIALFFLSSSGFAYTLSDPVSYIEAGTGIAQTSLYPAPLVYAYTESNRDGGLPYNGENPIYKGSTSYYFPAEAKLNYQFVVSGSGTDLIPLVMSYYAVTYSNFDYTITNGYQAWAHARGHIRLGGVTGISTQFFLMDIDREQNVYEGQMYFFATPNQVADVELWAYAAVHNAAFQKDGLLKSSLLIDPVIRIDSSFQNADQYSLLFSPGVGNSLHAVPEPSTALLFGIGLAGTAYAGRRMRKTQI